MKRTSSFHFPCPQSSRLKNQIRIKMSPDFNFFDIKEIDKELNEIGNVDFSIEEYDTLQAELTKLTSEILGEILPILGIYPEGDINYDITFEEEYEILDEVNDGFINEEVTAAE